MKLEIMAEEGFIGLDLIPEDLEDRKFCRGINLAFMAGDLHMSIDGSCLVVDYDSEQRSFPIRKKECEAIDKSLNAVLNGSARFLAGSILVVDAISKESYCVCIIRLLGKARDEGKDSQLKLVRSYIPPLSLPVRKSFVGGKKRLSIQEKVIDEPFFNDLNKSLFRVGKRKVTLQQEII